MEFLPRLRALFGLGLCLLPFAAHAESCNQYEPAVASLSGTLTRQVFPGGPGFEDLVRGDTPQVGFYLSLSEPLCMNGNGNEPQISADDNESLVQLVLQPTDYDNLRPYLDQPVVLTGNLFGATTAFHHTRVLLRQVQLVSGMAAAPVDCELLSQKATMHEQSFSPALRGRVIGASKAWIYQAPNPTCSNKRDYLRPGAVISVTSIRDGGWLRAQYSATDGKTYAVWLDQSQVVLRTGDMDDDSADAATTR
jgi:hypothetical protein